METCELLIVCRTPKNRKKSNNIGVMDFVMNPVSFTNHLLDNLGT